MVSKRRTGNINSDTIRFIQENVLNVADLARTTKLTEILDRYADRKSTEAYVIQNGRTRNAKGVLIDLEYFEELLLYKEAIEEAMDQIVYKVALDRKDASADISLEQAIQELDFDSQDLDDVIKLVEEGEDEG